VWCRLIGHRFRFTTEHDTMTWRCTRDCGAGGSKRYASSADAARYARAFDREDRADLGRRAPLVGLLPLRLARVIRRRSGGTSAHEIRRRGRLVEGQAVARTRPLRCDRAAGRVERAVEQHGLDAHVVVEPFQVPQIRGRGRDRSM